MAINPSSTTLSGLLSDRPATPNTGLKYYSTDTNQVSVFDGTVWHTDCFGSGGASGGSPTLVFSTATAAGVQTTFVRDDDTLKALDTATPQIVASGAGAAGTTFLASRSDHSHQLDFARLGSQPALVLATATASGAAVTYIRVNDTIKAFDGTAPSAVTTAAGIDGTTSFAQRSGHTHQHPQFAVGSDLHLDYVLAAGTRPLSAQWGVGPWSFLMTGSAAPATPGTAGLRAIWASSTLNDGMKVITKAGNTYSLEGATMEKGIGASAAGDLLNLSTAGTKFATTYTIPANALSVGRAIRVEAFGVFSASASTTSTSTFNLDGTAFGTGGAVALGAQTNRGWNLWGLLQCRATGSAGAAEFQGNVSYNVSVTGQAIADMEVTTSRTLDTTVSHVLAIGHVFNATSASTSINLRNLAVEWLGPEIS